MIKHPVKHPQKGHFCNVGLLRFFPGYKNVSNSDIILRKWIKKGIIFYSWNLYFWKSVGNSIFFDSDEIYTKFGDFWSIIFKFPILYTVIRLWWFMHHELHCGIFILKNLMWFDERVFDDDKIHLLDFWQTKYTLTDICSVWIDQTDLLYVDSFFLYSVLRYYDWREY